jgi:hypothetical protein
MEKRNVGILFYLRGSAVLHTLEHSRNDRIKYIVSQLQPARRCYIRDECNPNEDG